MLLKFTVWSDEKQAGNGEAWLETSAVLAVEPLRRSKGLASVVTLNGVGWQDVGSGHCPLAYNVLGTVEDTVKAVEHGRTADQVRGAERLARAFQTHWVGMGR